MIVHSVVSLLIAYIVFPLALLFLENIIPMVAGIISIAIIGVIIKFVFSLIHGNEESAGSSSSLISKSCMESEPKKREIVESKKLN